MRIEDALRLAQEAELDLVEVAATARPPVCKLMDYGKFKYESAQKARESRRNQQLTTIKEQKLRPKIDTHDYETKKRNVVRFLEGGNKVKVTIMFRGREQSRPELGFRLLQRLAEDVAELGDGRGGPEAGRAQHDDGDRSEQEAGRTARRGRRADCGRARGLTGREFHGNAPPDRPAPKHANSGAPSRGATGERNSHAQEQDPQRDREAGQDHWHRQAAPPADGPAAPARGQVERQTRRQTGTVAIAPADVKRVKKLLGR